METRHCGTQRQTGLYVVSLIVILAFIIIVITVICLQKFDQPTGQPVYPTTTYKNEFPKYVKWNKEDVKK